MTESFHSYLFQVAVYLLSDESGILTLYQTIDRLQHNFTLYNEGRHRPEQLCKNLFFMKNMTIISICSVPDTSKHCYMYICSLMSSLL